MAITKIILSSPNRLYMCHMKTWSKFLSMEFGITSFTISLKTVICRLSAVIKKQTQGPGNTKSESIPESFVRNVFSSFDIAK